MKIEKVIKEMEKIPLSTASVERLSMVLSVGSPCPPKFLTAVAKIKATRPESKKLCKKFKKWVRRLYNAVAECSQHQHSKEQLYPIHPFRITDLVTVLYCENKMLECWIHMDPKSGEHDDIRIPKTVKKWMTYIKDSSAEYSIIFERMDKNLISYNWYKNELTDLYEEVIYDDSSDSDKYDDFIDMCKRKDTDDADNHVESWDNEGNFSVTENEMRSSEIDIISGEAAIRCMIRDLYHTLYENNPDLMRPKCMKDVTAPNGSISILTRKGGAGGGERLIFGVDKMEEFLDKSSTEHNLERNDEEFFKYCEEHGLLIYARGESAKNPFLKRVQFGPSKSTLAYVFSLVKLKEFVDEDELLNPESDVDPDTQKFTGMIHNLYNMQVVNKPASREELNTPFLINKNGVECLAVPTNFLPIVAEDFDVEYQDFINFCKENMLISHPEQHIKTRVFFSDHSSEYMYLFKREDMASFLKDAEYVEDAVTAGGEE